VTLRSGSFAPLELGNACLQISHGAFKARDRGDVGVIFAARYQLKLSQKSFENRLQPIGQGSAGEIAKGLAQPLEQGVYLHRWILHLWILH